MAANLGWRTQRRPRGEHSGDVSAAAQTLSGYLQRFPKGSPQRRRLPTHAELLAAGRHDVRYALQVWIGSAPSWVADHLRVMMLLGGVPRVFVRSCRAPWVVPPTRSKSWRPFMKPYRPVTPESAVLASAGAWEQGTGGAVRAAAASEREAPRWRADRSPQARST